MSVKLVIDSRLVEFPGESLLIGRSAAAQLSLPDARLAEQHAILRQVAGRWLIEAQGDAVISVGNGRPTKVAWLSPDDVIRLTETGPTVVFSPTGAPLEVHFASPAAAPPLAVPMSAPPILTSPYAEPLRNEPLVEEALLDEAPPVNGPVLKRASKKSPQKSPQKSQTVEIPAIAWISGSAALVLFGLIVAFAVIASRRPTGDSPAPDTNVVSLDSPPTVTPETSVANLPVAIDKPAPNAKPMPVEDVTPPPEPVEKPQKPTDAATVPVELPTSAVRLVLVSAPDRDQTYRLGAAWAVGQRKLVTSGAVGLGILQLREQLPKATIQGEDKSAAAVIQEVLVHPEYRRLAAEASAAQTELDELRSEVEDSEEASAAESLEPKMIAVQNRLLDALQQQLDYDIAVLEVDRDLPATLKVSDDVAGVRPGAAVRLIGIPFPMDEFLIDPEAVVDAAIVSGQVQAKAPAQGAEIRRWLVKFRDAKPEDNWSGSPVVNAEGAVIGLYSRPTPPMELREDYIPTTHEITSIQRLAEVK